MGSYNRPPNLQRETSSNSPAWPGDAELVARARGGDRAAFDALVLRHQDRVYNMAFRMLGDREEALDAAQEIFLAAYRSLGAFESKARFSTWLYRVTVNRCRDELRKRGTAKHARPASLEGAQNRSIEPPAPGGADPARAAEARERHEAVARAIASLPEETRAAVVLRDVQGLSYEEIAEVLGVPAGTVRSRIFRGRAQLRAELAPEAGRRA
jgi:RNA polymerase sigma-70 factor (ECF subfamily)